MTNRYRVEPASTVDLAGFDTRDTSAFDVGKTEGRTLLKGLVRELAELQRVMWAENRHKLLVVLQAMDTGGKDGTIRNVFSGVNPQGVHVANFKKPTAPEIEHDYLWRIHTHTPGNGEIVVFNRSHYEDVLVVRVLDLVPEERWRRRYGHINVFERLLSDEGTTIVKFYLHNSKEEKKKRLQARLDDPSKHWKFNTGDLDHRKLWPRYMEAFEEALSRTSTAHAPWYIVPADRKWYRNLVVADTLCRTLRGLEMSYPEAEEDLSAVVVE
ncbi:MAG: polyphosphate kinase 2 family protein [Acidimicrobiia bacterium]